MKSSYLAWRFGDMEGYFVGILNLGHRRTETVLVYVREDPRRTYLRDMPGGWCTAWIVWREGETGWQRCDETPVNTNAIAWLYPVSEPVHFIEGQREHEQSRR